MKRKIIGIFVCTLLIIATHGIATQSIISNQQNQTTSNEPIIIEPLPVKKVKEIPVPWQFWEEFPQEGVLAVIVLPQNVSAVAIVRTYAVLREEVPLEDLFWDNNYNTSLHMIDDPMEPYILEPNGQTEYFIPTTPYDKAVIVRYTVALADTPGVIIGHFVNEVILNGRGTIIGTLTNFDVHNDYSKPINNFELELYRINLTSTDITGWYDDKLGLDPTLTNTSFGTCWYNGWGVPPQINNKSYGVEMVWIDKKHPVKPCEWIHFGVSLKPGVTIKGARAYFTITTPRDNPVNYKNSYNFLFLKFFEKHQNLFPIIQKILNRLVQ